MSDPQRFRLVDLILLMVILATAAGARVGYLLNYTDNGAKDGPLLVQDAAPVLDLPADTAMRGQAPPTEQDALIENIRDHHWFGCLAPFADGEERTAHVAPGYPWLVGTLERSTAAADPFMRWLQCLLGTLTAGLYYLTARRAFGQRLVAGLAGLLGAVHPFWIVNTAEINDGVLTTFLLAACLWLGVRASQVEGAGACFLFGLGLAGLALVRAALLPFAAVALLWFLRRCRHAPSGWQFGLLAVLGLFLGLAPWTIRNVQAFGDIFPIVDSTYLHLWIGNNPQATGGPLAEATLRPADLADGEDLASLSQPARYRRLGQAAIDKIKRDPTAAIERRIWAGLYFFFGADWFSSGRLWRTPTGESGDVPPIYPPLLTGFLLGMLLLGSLGWRWAVGEQAQLLALAVIWVPLPYLLSHAEALSGPRLPLDGVFLCYGAFVLSCLIPQVAQKLLWPKREEPLC